MSDQPFTIITVMLLGQSDQPIQPARFISSARIPSEDQLSSSAPSFVLEFDDAEIILLK